MNIFKEQSKTQEQSHLSAEEVHRIWTKTQSRYIVINHIKFVSNIVHDRDFKGVLAKINKMFIKHCSMYEKKMDEYSIKSPEPNKTDIDTIINHEAISDKQISRTLYSLFQNCLTECFQTLYDGSYNDNIRELLIALMKEEIEIFYDYVDYIIAKGWLEYPPFYPNAKENKRVAANAVWQLWQHLDYRYLNIQQTKIMGSYASNEDFQSILKTGIKILENQINKLEKILLDYGVNLPDRYPKNIPTPETKEIFDDKYLFNVLISAMKNATTIHGFGIRELLINDKPRKLFKELIYDEIYYIDKLLRYGKVMGWTSIVPVYKT